MVVLNVAEFVIGVFLYPSLVGPNGIQLVACALKEVAYCLFRLLHSNLGSEKSIIFP